MQGYAFIDQSSMRAAPGEAERAGKARCEARWGPWGRPWWEEEASGHLGPVANKPKGA